MKLKSILACWEPELSMNTEASEKRIRRQVMHRVLVPNMHFEGLFASCILCLDPLVPILLQFLLKRFMYTSIFFPGYLGPSIINIRKMFFLFIISERGGK